MPKEGGILIICMDSVMIIKACDQSEIALWLVEVDSTILSYCRGGARNFLTRGLSSPTRGLPPPPPAPPPDFFEIWCS